MGFLEFFLWFQLLKEILSLVTEVAQFSAEGPSFTVQLPLNLLPYETSIEDLSK